MARFPIDNALLREPNLWVPGKKPVGNVKIDWGHPLADGIEMYLPMDSKMDHDLVTYNRITSTPNAQDRVTETVGRKGKQLTSRNDAAEGWIYSMPANITFTSNEYIVFAAVCKANTSGSPWSTLFRLNHAGAIGFFIYLPNDANATNTVDIYYDGNLGPVADANYVDDEWHLYLMQMPCNTSNQSCEFYRDGALFSTDVSYNTTSILHTYNEIDILNNSEWPEESYIGDCAGMWFWKGAKWDSLKVKEFSDDPYQFLIPS